MISIHPVLLTEDGLTKLEQDLEYLMSVRRVEIAEDLHEAFSGGDNLDNTEYQAVQYEQLLLESRISYLQQLIANAKLIEPGVDGDLVKIGDRVVLQDEMDQLETYLIVGPIEADPMNGRISYECPLGQALIDRRSGDLVHVNAPDGEAKYRIISVT